MSYTPTSTGNDDCSICLTPLGLGASLLTLSCGHKFHLQCLVSNVQAQNKECPLCRATIDTSLIRMLSVPTQSPLQQPSYQQGPNPADNNPQAPQVIPLPSIEDPIDEVSVRQVSARVAEARQAAISSYSTSNIPLITATTTLEYGGQPSDHQSNIFGLVTLKAPPAIVQSDSESLSSARVPVDLVCVVDQSGSMGGQKIALLKQTLIYITEQLNDLDRLAIISFDTSAFDRSHGLKRMNQQNQTTLKRAIEHDINDGGGTYIGKGLEMGIQILNNRQTKNPLGALLLLTDGQDNDQHDYTQLMQTLPEDIQCHTFGYGSDHTPALLVQLAEQGHGGTFTYVDEQQAVGPAFAMALAGLFTCVAQEIRVDIQFTGGYQITNIHSKYPYEPEQFPSSQILFKLNNLNVDENRNLVFQLHVPKIEDEQTVEMNSLSTMSQDQSEDGQQITPNQHVIGHVSVTYVEPNNNQTFTTEPVPFHLIRVPNPSSEHLQINYTLDLQRNRVETAHLLKLAMEEYDYKKSLALLKAQVEKIQASVSAQDPFCQSLIKDLQHHFPSEREYRSSHHNCSNVHTTERGTYFPTSTTSTRRYQNTRQLQQAADYTDKHS